MVIRKIAKPLIAVLILAAVLRFYHLGFNPPSPYWEEAALGYDAYSILKTGKDFHGHSWPLIAFESFGDYKPSLYFYATVPSVAIFGLNTFAVRFPSAFFWHTDGFAGLLVSERSAGRFSRCLTFGGFPLASSALPCRLRGQPGFVFTGFECFLESGFGFIDVCLPC